MTKGNLFEFLLACALVLAAVQRNRFGRLVLAGTRDFALRMARHEARAIALAAAFPVIVRLLLLPIDPVPQPYDMEEFNHLLQADTYALGRLANPVHPLAVMLQSYQIVSWPHYMSGRPPLPAMFLSIGALFGSPFAGNLLAVALTAAALCWMLLGWVPRRWAMIGSLLAINNFCLFGYWVNSFWCPTTIVLGGALLIGVVPRVERTPRLRWAAAFVVGLVLLAGTRPYENGVYAGTICLWLAQRFLRPERRRLLRIGALRFALPVSLGAIAIVVAQLGYDRATTGSSRLMPYQIWRASQDVTPMFLWQPLAAPPVFYNASAAQYSRWDTSVVTAVTRGGLFGAVLLLGRQAVTFRDLLGPTLFLPLLCWSPAWFSARLRRRWPFVAACWLVFFLLFVAFGWPAALIETFVVLIWLLRWRRADERLPILLMLAGIGATSVTSFSMTIYLAAFTAPLLILLVNGLRHLSLWSGRAGPSLAGYVVLGSTIMPVAQAAALAMGAPLSGGCMSHFDRIYPSPRRVAIGALKGAAGRLVVFVRVQGNAPIDPVWLDPVWNAADIDGQRIVWLRDLRPEWTAAAEEYFRGRQFMLMLMDGSGRFRLGRYPSAALPPAAPLSSLPMPDREVAKALGGRER